MDAVLNWVWQGGVVAAVSLVMLFLLKRAGANVRSAVCWAALLLIVALPAFPPLSFTTPAVGAFLPTPADAVVSLPATWWTSTLVILAAWMAWGSVQSVRLVMAIVAIRRARARSRRFPPHLESHLSHWNRIRSEGRRATLVLSNSVTSAAVLGWGAPMIAVAPSLLRTLDPDDLDRVLIHEWAHVQRRDDVVNVLQVVVRIVAGWHPALWSIDRRLSLEREIACDEVTVAITGSPKSVRGVSAETLDAERHAAAHADRAGCFHAVRSARARGQDRISAPVHRAAVVCHAGGPDDRGAVPGSGCGWRPDARGSDRIRAAIDVGSHAHQGPLVLREVSIAADTKTARPQRRARCAVFFVSGAEEGTAGTSCPAHTRTDGAADVPPAGIRGGDSPDSSRPGARGNAHA